MGTGGTKTGEVMYAHMTNEGEMNAVRGKLRGKWVMLDTAQSADPHFAGDACRFDESQLAGMVSSETEFNCRTPANAQIARADSIKRAAANGAGRGGRGGGRGGPGGA